jgi:hypothetical protein
LEIWAFDFTTNQWDDHQPYDVVRTDTTNPVSWNGVDFYHWSISGSFAPHHWHCLPESVPPSYRKATARIKIRARDNAPYFAYTQGGFLYHVVDPFLECWAANQGWIPFLQNCVASGSPVIEITASYPGCALPP